MEEKGTTPPECFYVKDAHPLHVMVWGGIGPNGFKTNLIRCPKSVTAETYCQFLADSHVLFQCKSCLGDNFYWQQDGAPAHSSVADLIKQHVPNMIDWPAKSPDLSPIEQIWALIKWNLRGRSFGSEDELFAALKEEWNKLDPKQVHTLWESYWARCRVCINIGGKSLNGHWKEVHDVHNTYRRR